MGAGYVYLLAETSDGVNHTRLYKIGKTTAASSEDRKRQYQAGNARPLILLCEAYVSDCQYWETTIQSYWKGEGKHWHFPGGGDEWFHFDDNDVNYTIAWMYQVYQSENSYEKPEPEPEPEYDYSAIYHYEESGFPAWGYAIGLLVGFIVIAAAGSSVHQSGIHRGGRSLRDNTTPGNSYPVLCIDGGTKVRIREKTSLKAKDRAIVKCNRDRVTVLGEPVIDGIPWLKVQTQDGVKGYIPKAAIDP